MKVNFFDKVNDQLLKFAVIMCEYRGKWVFCKHKDRDTYEIPGGHRDKGESILEAAKRELFEETGATRYHIRPVCAYSVKDHEETYGMLYYSQIEEFSELGSGFNLAMQDLDIRGSGNLLGGEQSGFIAEVGFETYQRILNEALMELKETGPGDQDQDTNKLTCHREESPGKIFISDFQIDTDLEIMFPDEYVSNISERIRLYKELNEIDSEESLGIFKTKLTDRFGRIPPPAEDLLDIVRIKWIAVKLGIEKILLKNDLLIANFISDQNSEFYRSNLFISVMNYVNRFHGKMSVRQKESKLSLTIKEIRSVKGAISVLNEIRTNIR